MTPNRLAILMFFIARFSINKLIDRPYSKLVLAIFVILLFYAIGTFINGNMFARKTLFFYKLFPIYFGLVYLFLYLLEIELLNRDIVSLGAISCLVIGGFSYYKLYHSK